MANNVARKTSHLSDERLRDILGLSVSVLATEHLFTFSLSSLPTTKKWYSTGTEQDKADVRKASNIATVLSLGFGSLMSIMLKRPTPFIAAAGLSALFAWMYERSLDGKI